MIEDHIESQDDSKKNIIFTLMEYSEQGLANEINNKLNNKEFRNFYIYNMEGISSMLYHTLRNKEVMKELIKRKDDDNYFGLGSDTGIAMTDYSGVSKIGHSGCSIAQTIFIVQQIIRKGIDNVDDFYKNLYLTNSRKYMNDINDININI